MKRTFKSGLIAAAVTLLSWQGVQAASSVAASADESTKLWFVELAGAPVADGRALNAVRAEKAAFRAAAAAARVRYTERRSFDTLFNGFSVHVDAAERARLLRLPGVKAMYPVLHVAAPTPAEAAQVGLDMAAAVGLTGADVARQQLGLTGRGVKVGIIDTGIDIDHPAFGGGGAPGGTAFPSARIVAGYDFVGDNYNAGGTPEQQVPVPDENPDDCNGHGTHVAGIVGGNGGGIVGVAPDVSFGAYRVFGCAGSSASDIIMAALERAYADGMQVINQSLGAARQWPEYPTAKASSRLVNRGVVMVASIGNNGPGGSSPDALYAAGAPGVGEKVIGVASFDNAQQSFTVNGTPYGYTQASASPAAPTSGSLPMSKTGNPGVVNDLCDPVAPGSLADTAVLVRRGTCPFHTKALNAQNAGAAAVVLYNNTGGALAATVAGTPPVTIPVVGITSAQGAALDAAIASGPTTLIWGDQYVSFPFGTGGLISGFSSFGMAADLSLKPNIGAPGGGILSAYPLELGATATLSGTSMSAPHVAGGVALILQADPSIRARQMQARLQNTAVPRNWSGNAALGLLDHSFRQGAGMLDIMGVIQNTALVTPSQLSLGESQAGPQTRTISVTNRTSAPVTYNLSHVASVAAGPNSTTGASYALTGVFDAPAAVSFSRPSVTVPARGRAAFDVTVAASASLPDRALYGGYVVLTPTNGTAPLRVPYGGFKGDYQSIQVLAPTANGFPWLASLAGNTFSRLNDGGTFTMTDGENIPYFLIHFDHHSTEVRLEAIEAATGRVIGNVSRDKWFGRNSTPGGFFSFAWDGSTYRGTSENPGPVRGAPNGQYVVKLSVLKALGDPNNSNHWETWTSPPITIARP